MAAGGRCARLARPTARAGPLFADVRREGRWLVTTPGAVSEPSEAFWIGEMIRAAEHLVLVAEADGEVVGNVLVSVDRGARPSTSASCRSASPTVGAMWDRLRAGRDRRGGRARAASASCPLGVFPDNERAIAVYEKRGFVREGLRRMQYRSGGAFRDEVLMAWFPRVAEASRDESDR